MVEVCSYGVSILLASAQSRNSLLETHPFSRLSRRISHELVTGTFPRLLARGAAADFSVLHDCRPSSGLFS